MNEPEVNNVRLVADYLKEHSISQNEIYQLTSLFSSEINNYCELVQGMNRDAYGIVIKGDGARFSKRNADMLESRFSNESVRHYYWLAELFEHKGGLSKFEWKKNENDENVFSQSNYFRRRPQVNEMLNRYLGIGVSKDVLTQLNVLSSILDKNSIHFVAASFNPDLGIIHKWYFSQFVDQNSYNVILGRILYILELFKTDPESIHLFLSNYARLVHFQKVSTLFISFSFNVSEIIPSVKIDLTEIDSADYLPLLNGSKRLQNETVPNTLSYLGIRFFRNRKLNLKYYVTNCPKPFPVLPVSAARY